MTYALDQSTGRLYTEEEYWEEYKYALPDRAVVLTCWDNLPHVECADEDIDKLRQSMLYIYQPVERPPVGSILKTSLESDQSWVVTSHIGDTMIRVQSTKGGLFMICPHQDMIVVASSLVDMMRPSQFLYNMAMYNQNKFG